MKRTPLLLTAFLAAISLTACSFSLAEDITPPPSYQSPPQAPQATEAQVALVPPVSPDPGNGEAIYVEKCAACHGPTGRGDGEQASLLENPPTALGDPEVAHAATLAGWYEVVTNGRMDRFMPPFTSLSDQQRWDVAAYALTLSSDPQAIIDSAALFEQECAGCHGPQGSGAGPLAPLSDPATAAGKSAETYYNIITSGTADMPAYQDTLSEDQRWALADYTRSLMFAPAAGAQAEAPSASSTSVAEVTSTPALPASEEITATTEISAAAEVGSLGGKLVNQSSDPLPQGQMVTIHAFDNMAIAETFTTTVAADGTFSLGQVDMPAGRVFMATTEINGALYTSDIASVDAATTAIDLQIVVWGTTTDTSQLSVDRLHLFFDFSNAEYVQVVELFLITNPTDRTIVAEENGGPVITFMLPEGAANLQFQDSGLGERYVETPGGFGDTSPIQPGTAQQQVLFAYDMPYDRKLNLSIPLTLPVGAVTVLLPDNGVQVNSDQLQDGGTRDVQGTAYRMYNGGAINRGDTLSLNLNGKPGDGTSFLNLGNVSTLVIVIAGLGVVLVALGVGMYFYTRTKSEPEPEPAYEENEENLMDAIISLDDSYKEGKLSEEAYRARRAELKTKLQRLQDDHG